MARKFITVDYQATLDLEISLREALPPDHLAHFIVEVIAELDLRRIYQLALAPTPRGKYQDLFSLNCRSFFHLPQVIECKNLGKVWCFKLNRSGYLS